MLTSLVAPFKPDLSAGELLSTTVISNPESGTSNPRDENLRRFRIGGLNNTKQQTRNIMSGISKKYAENDYKSLKEVNYFRGAALLERH